MSTCRTIQLNLLFTGFLCLTACDKFNPVYHQPIVDTPKISRSGMIFSPNQDTHELTWWYKMHDPVLNQLIEETLQHNNQIMSAKHQIFEAQAELKSAQYAWIPTLNASTSGFFGNTISPNITQQGSPSHILPSGNGANGKFHGYSGGFVPGYSFNLFENINQINWAKASLEEQKAYASAIRLSLVSQVSGAYFMLLGLKKQLALQTVLITDLKNIRKVASNRLHAGKNDWASVYALDSQIRLNQSNLPLIENSIAKTENAIQCLINRNPGKVVVYKDINTLPIKGLIPTQLSSNVLKNRPDIMMAEDRLKMANANIGLAQSVFFPTINLTSLFGGASMALSHLLSVSTGYWVNQANISMPILNSSSYEIIKAAKNGYYVAYYDYMQTVKAAFADVDNALTNHQKINQNYDEIREYVNNMEALYRIALNQYRIGLLNYDEVLRKKIDWDSARLTLNQAKMQQLDSIVIVYGALIFI